MNEPISYLSIPVVEAARQRRKERQSVRARLESLAHQDITPVASEEAQKPVCLVSGCQMRQGTEPGQGRK